VERSGEDFVLRVAIAGNPSNLRCNYPIASPLQQSGDYAIAEITVPTDCCTPSVVVDGCTGRSVRAAGVGGKGAVEDGDYCINLTRQADGYASESGSLPFTVREGDSWLAFGAVSVLENPVDIFIDAVLRRSALGYLEGLNSIVSCDRLSESRAYCESKGFKVRGYFSDSISFARSVRQLAIAGNLIDFRIGNQIGFIPNEPDKPAALILPENANDWEISTGENWGYYLCDRVVWGDVCGSPLIGGVDIERVTPVRRTDALRLGKTAKLSPFEGWHPCDEAIVNVASRWGIAHQHKLLSVACTVTAGFGRILRVGQVVAAIHPFMQKGVSGIVDPASPKEPSQWQSAKGAIVYTFDGQSVKAFSPALSVSAIAKSFKGRFYIARSPARYQQFRIVEIDRYGPVTRLLAYAIG
jgi:hypothetical protein